MVMQNVQIKILYNIRKSKSDLRLHNFREVKLGNKKLGGSNKLTE